MKDLDRLLDQGGLNKFIPQTISLPGPSGVTIVCNTDLFYYDIDCATEKLLRQLSQPLLMVHFAEHVILHTWLALELDPIPVALCLNPLATGQ
jgi:hypothetical protein